MSDQLIVLKGSFWKQDEDEWKRRKADQLDWFL